MTRVLLELPEPLSPEQLAQLELPLSDGLGGYCLTTPAQTRPRADQGLLVVALEPPERRHLLLARLDERARMEQGDWVELNCHHYPRTLSPRGDQQVQAVGYGPFPTVRFQVGESLLERTLFTLVGVPGVGVRYRRLSGPGLRLEVRPLLAFRALGALTNANPGLQPEVLAEAQGVSCQPYPALPRLYLSAPGGTWQGSPYWYYRVQYPADQAQGEFGQEDLWTPGLFELDLSSQEATTWLATVDPALAERADQVWEEALAQQARRQAAVSDQALPSGRLLLPLVDLYLQPEGPHARLLETPLGAPVSPELASRVLPALLGATGRWEEARGVLGWLASLDFARHPSMNTGFLLGLALTLRAAGRPREVEAWRGAILAALKVRPGLRSSLESLAEASWWAAALGAGAWLSAELGEEALARSLRQERHSWQRHYAPTPRWEEAPLEAQLLALGLPWPLWSGPVGWAEADRLLRSPELLEVLSPEDWGRLAAVVRQHGSSQALQWRAQLEERTRQLPYLPMRLCGEARGLESKPEWPSLAVLAGLLEALC